MHRRLEATERTISFMDTFVYISSILGGFALTITLFMLAWFNYQRQEKRKALMFLAFALLISVIFVYGILLGRV